MLTDGPAMAYVPAVRANPTNTVAFSGYQIEATPGRDLLETGNAEIDSRRMQVAASVGQYDLFAHADHEGPRSFLASYPDAAVLVNHEEGAERFADRLREDSFHAAAPALGETVEV